ncbi:ABC transporter amino acid permease [Luminiphilus syltensis NOR5-1B]|uniref:ABC transporter amino acid permease n=1 Tax=Luminiphilus syltensis NOR5-1B TaxID=565045 RepID=B8KU13_9GAMM|nr:glycine betaine ABC transporter substrate-binding protein [Luminiphilus syltensis]EED36320.1 ABC transporter amino acid permease [Luminiphilus syltensis NOR5-1B]
MQAIFRVCVLVLAIAQTSVAFADGIRVASKTFVESYLLGEMVTQLLSARGVEAEHQQGLGGTLVTFTALGTGEIDVYPDYTGTLAQAVLGQPELTGAALIEALNARGLRIAVNLGFSNSYALAIPETLAQELSISTISDLARHPDLRGVFSHEFLRRNDGWSSLRRYYGLQQQAAGIEHALAYDALASGSADLTEAYTTDGELVERGLVVLEDDRGFFPEYAAVLLVREDLSESAVRHLQELSGVLDAQRMRSLNHRVSILGETPAAVAQSALAELGLVAMEEGAAESRLARVLGTTMTHLKLTLIAFVLACVVAIPLALVLARFERISRGLIYLAGLIQTIPSLALLALLIPLVGLGQIPAIIALFLYSLLPLIRNTLAGLFSVDPLLIEVADGMGLTHRQRLRLIEVPLAMPMILAGMKTAVVVSIGTATLAAFVGAGGLGEPIIAGLNLNNTTLILEGAIPAACLAMAAELLFESIERRLIPAHLQPGLRD